MTTTYKSDKYKTDIQLLYFSELFSLLMIFISAYHVCTWQSVLCLTLDSETNCNKCTLANLDKCLIVVISS